MLAFLVSYSGDSILGNSTLWQVLANWLTYVYKPMTKKKVVFIIILFGLCIV